MSVAKRSRACLADLADSWPFGALWPHRRNSLRLPKMIGYDWRKRRSSPSLALSRVQLQVTRTAEPDDEQRTRIVGVVTFAVGVSATSAGLLPQFAAQPAFVREHAHIVPSALLWRQRVGLAPSPHLRCVARPTVRPLLALLEFAAAAAGGLSSRHQPAPSSSRK